MANNSDFKKPFSDLFELLPEVFQSQTNESVFRNVFNRYLSKPEIERVNGIIGQAAGSLGDRQLTEPTPHRQAYQLQPLLFTRIGGENTIASYVDVLNELERLGVEDCRQKLWGNALQFNWIPPIDLDKIINFRRYYWVDPINPASSPQYVTIKNPCTQAEQAVAGYQLTLDTYGEEFDIQGIDVTNDAFVIPGDITPVFVEDFVFFVKQSTNADINQKFFTTVSSSYDSGTGQTTIYVAEDIAVNTPVDGVVSILENMVAFVAQKNCVCGGDVGWSVAPWDNNQVGSVLWTDGFLPAISHPQNPNGDPQGDTDWVAANGAPSLNDLWFDTTDNELKQYDGGNWVVVQQNFQALIDFIDESGGNNFWDFTEGCVVEENQWIDQNKWVHENSVTNFGAAKRATQPIIEYDATLQLNKWNWTEFVWQYRESQFFDFSDTTVKPHLNELIPFLFVINNATTITLSPTHGDQTGVFTPGYSFRVLGDTQVPSNDGVYTVASSTFTNNETVVTINETFPSISDSLTFSGVVTPQVTSLGDSWRLYDEHWLLTERIEPVPITPRTENPNLEIDVLGIPTIVPGVGQYLMSDTIDPTAYLGPATEYAYAMEWTITNPGQTTLNFDPLMVERARAGENDVRVFVDGIRQYGQFSEINGVPFVTGIIFDAALPVNSIVRIEVGEPALEDTGRHSISVLTESGVVDDSLIRYRRSEQVKNDVNQYPLFDVVNVDGTDSYQANHIFGYLTSQDAPIDPDTGFRIVINGEDDYVFEQLILEEDNGKMYAFILGGEVQTIWRKGLNDEEYIPEYVDADRNVVPVGDPNGFWEIPDQLYYNAEHENRVQLSFTELFTHFNSIVQAQGTIPGFILPGNTFYLNLNPNYGLGGTIKEHNDSYDTLLSSTYVDNVTPLGVVDFAHDEYQNSLNTLKEFYRSNLVSYLTDTTATVIEDLSGYITDTVINAYEINDAFAYVYNDSNTYIAATDTGVKNWPATLPFVRMAYKQVPYVIEDEEQDIRQLVHHDGHRSVPSLTTTTIESVVQTTLNTLDTRVDPAEPFGQQSTSAPPDSYADLLLTTTPRSGIYWYQVTGGVRTLYRFNVVAVSNIPPVGVSAGALWYDTDTDTLRELSVGLTWDAVTVVGDGLITDAWIEIDLNDLLTNIWLEVENRLYEAAPDLTELAFDVTTLPSSTVSCPDLDPTTTEEDYYNLYLQEAFGSWLRDQDIVDPFSSDQFYDPVDPFTWNYKQSVIVTFPSSLNTGTESGGWWTDLYDKLYGTPYPHLEPWKLQGYGEKPSWWDAEYLDTSGTRRWIYDHGLTTGMWENIRVGAVPVGQLLPDGLGVGTGTPGDVTVTYNYFSVNIGDVATLDGIDPDEILPPFWDFVANGGSAVIRSPIETFGQVVNPSADYVFMDRGPVEFEWTQTAQRLYDDLTVSFKMQPVRFFHSTFGEEFIYVGGLNISPDLCKVYSHKDVRFHGDIVNVNQLLQFQGLNQWYVNFNRSSGFDTTSSNFRPLWQNWDPLLTYQFGSVIDTDTFQIDNPNFDVNARDYRIALKKSIGIDNKTYESLNFSVLQIPNRLVSTDTESLWTFLVDTFSPTAQTLQYYNVRNYPIRPDVLTNTFNLYQFDVVDIDQLGGAFSLAGDQREAFTLSNDFTITNSTGNNGSYTATAVVYDSVQHRTHISVGASLVDPTVDGILTADYRQHPWETGQAVELTTTVNAPSPIRANVPYYVINISPTSFQLARTQADALAGIPINVSSAGAGLHYVGQINYKFTVVDRQISAPRDWIHYVLDTDSVLQLTPPTVYRGVQNAINFIDGYAQFEKDEGFVFNADKIDTDLDLNKPITWETETERFLESIFRLRAFREEKTEQFNVNTNPLTDELVFAAEQPSWATGQKVQVFAYDGAVPSPLVQASPYYLIRNELDRVQLALTRTDALLGNAIDILTGGTGRVFLQEHITGKRTIESFEVNPARNNLWVQHDQGILSDIDVGASIDIRNTQLITDQNGEKLTTEELGVFRQDKLSRIFIQNAVPDPTKPVSQQNPQRDYRHISTANVFIDGVEHVILFNDDSVEGFLIYDPFLGLNTSYFEVLFFRQDEFTQRPVVGGYFLTADDQLLRNIESSVIDLQQAYDTYQALETTDLVEEGRHSLGYGGAGTQDYLTELNVSPKTQFAFWRGFIQNKGATTGLDAYVNSRTFGGAEVDEYWAFKVAEFGSPRQQEYPELKLIEQDGQRTEKRFEFLDPDMSRFEADDTFEGVFVSDQGRWNNQPNQAAVLSDNFDTLYFKSEITDVFTFRSVADGSVVSSLIGAPPAYIVQFRAPRFAITEDITANTFTLTNANPGWKTGKRVRFDATNVNINFTPPIALDTDYYVIETVTPNIIQLAETKEDAFDGNAIDIKGNILFQDETSYNGIGSNGTFVGADNAVVGEQITLSGGVVIEVDAVIGINDTVDQFTIIDTGTSGADVGEALAQISTTGSATGFILTPDTNNLDESPFGDPLLFDPLVDQPVYFDEVTILRVNTTTNTLVGELIEGIDYTHINSQIVSFADDPVNGTTTFPGALTADEEYRMYAINPAKQTHNPAKVIDVVDDIVINDVPVWDPRRNHQYHIANNVVTIESELDPASYTNSLDTANIDTAAWREPEIGEVWWDTSSREYVPYHDTTIFNLENRSRNWGKLSEWASVDLYQWTESDIPPSEYDDQAAIETTDITIDPRVRKSGTAKADIFRRERETIAIDSVVVSNNPVDPNTIFVTDPSGSLLSVGDRVVFTTTNTLPAPLEIGTFYYVTFVGAPVGDNTPIRVSLTEGGADVNIQPGALVFDISGAASSISAPTYLLNDFGLAGFQEAQYGVALTSGTATNYLTGTNGFATVTLAPGQALGDTPYPAGDYGSGASVLVADASAALGSNTTFAIGEYHVTEVEVDGYVANVFIRPSLSPSYPGFGNYTYAMLATDIETQVNSQLSVRGASVTVTIEAGVGVRITSDTAVVGGYVNTRTGDPGFDGGDQYRNLWRQMGAVTDKTATPSAGAPITEFTGTVTVDGTTILPISITADEAPTYSDLIDEINTQLGTFATASLVAGNLQITAASTGTSSTVTLVGSIFTGLDAYSSISSTAGTGFVYGAEFTIDGSVVQTVTFIGDEAPTVGDLIDILNEQLSGAFADIDGSNIVVSSTSIGINSSISINDVVGGTLPLFDSMITGQFLGFGVSTIGADPQQYTVDVVTQGQTQNVIVTGNQVQTYGELIDEINNDLAIGEIIVNLDGNLQIENGSQQVSIENDELFKYLSTVAPVASPPTLPVSPAVVDIFNIDTGVGSHQVVPSFADDWVQLRRVVKELIPARDAATVAYTLFYVGTGVFPNNIQDGDDVDIYINGAFYASQTVSGTSINLPSGLVNANDFITVVKEVPELTTEEAAFDPDTSDDGSFLVQRKEDYSYSVRNTINEFGETTQTYYFWVQDKTTRVDSNPSLINAEISLTTIPIPFMIFDKLIESDVSANGSPIVGIPQRYTQAIIKGLAGIINDDNRYVLRFTTDETLRDILEPRNFPSDLPTDFSRVKQEPLDLKNLHAEWTLLREGQSFKIPRDLWDKITEAVIGRELDNPTVRVPALERELYDLQFSTQTQYGLRAGQAFVNGQLALDTALDDIQDPDNDFSPVDITSFFSNADTLTEAGLIQFFDDIYNTFSVEDVNRIYFKVLLDALSTKDKYPDLFKTSWVSLEGTQVLQTEALVNG